MKADRPAGEMQTGVQTEFGQLLSGQRGQRRRQPGACAPARARAHTPVYKNPPERLLAEL